MRNVRSLSRIGSWENLGAAIDMLNVAKPAEPPSSSLLSLVLLAACCCLAPAALAQSTSPPNTSAPITLTDAIHLADANYPAIRAAQQQELAAKRNIGVAKTGYLPRADILWQTNRATANNIYGLLLPQGIIPTISGPVVSSDVTRSAWSSAGGALLSWQPFDFGVRRSQVNIAREGADAAKYASALTQLDAKAAAGAAFFDVAAAQQQVAVAQANVARIEVFDRAVRVLADNALRPGVDVSQADAQLAIARTQLIQAQTQEQIRLATLSAYLQLPAGQQLAIDASVLQTAPPAVDPEPNAIKDHPAALQQAARVGQEREQLHLLSRSYVPVFSTMGAVSGRGAGTSLDGNFPGGTAGLAPDTFNWAAGVQATFSAFDFFLNRDQQRVQQANLGAEASHYDQIVDDLSVAVQQARATLAGARAVARNTPIELRAARTSEEQQQVRYRSGLATVVDVAVAEGVLAQAEGDAAIARLSVWRGLLGVAAAQGNLTPFLQSLRNRP